MTNPGDANVISNRDAQQVAVRLFTERPVAEHNDAAPDRRVSGFDDLPIRGTVLELSFHSERL